MLQHKFLVLYVVKDCHRVPSTAEMVVLSSHFLSTSIAALLIEHRLAKCEAG